MVLHCYNKYYKETQIMVLGNDESISVKGEEGVDKRTLMIHSGKSTIITFISSKSSKKSINEI